MTRRWLDQVEALAREALPEPVFRYVAEGARDEISVGEAVAAWQSIRVAPRILRDVRHVETSTELLGTAYDLPLGIAPMTLQRAADPDGEVAMARAAAAAGVPMVVSSNSGSTFGDIAETGASWWLQIYLPPRREDAAPLLKEAVAAGVAAVVLTADTPVLGTRYPLPDGPHVWDMADPTWLNANASPASGLQPEDRAKAMDLGPDDVAWLAETTGLPVVVKGVLRGDDGRRCAEAGAAAVWISNHGGRQLDQTVATAGCVSAVRAAVPSGVQVYVDGGVCSGLHVLLAVALGADAAFVGRPMFHALAAEGEEGARRALEELGAELVESMRLAGCPTLADTREIVLPTSLPDSPEGR